MASEQMHRIGVYSEAFLEIREVHIHKQIKDQSQSSTDEDKFEKKGERKGKKEAAKGLRDREEKETREKMEAKHAKAVEHTKETDSKQREKEQDERSEEKTMDDDAIANGQERAKQEARNKEKESQAKRVAQNKESKEMPSEKTTSTKSFEERQEQKNQEGLEKSCAVCPLLQMANESNKGVFGETKIQHAEKMNKTDENLQSQEGGKDKSQSPADEDKFEKKGEKKGRKEAAKGLRDREEKETREKMEGKHAKAVEYNKETDSKQREKEQDERSEKISKCRAQKTMDDDAIANGQERAKQEGRNEEKESEAKKVAQNKESKEVPSEKTTTTKSIEERQEQKNQEGIEKFGAVCSLPQMANESNSLKSFQGVQDRDKGVFGETKIQHAEKMNKTDENLQSQEGEKTKKMYATYADAVKLNTCTKGVQEQHIHENIAEKDFEEKKEQPQVSGVDMVKEPLDKEDFEGEKEQPEAQVSVMQMVKEPLDKAAEGGMNVLGAVGETVAEIGENMMKPAEKVREKNEDGKGGGVLSAIGETVAEIAQTAKVIAVGEGDAESKQRIESKSL